MTNKLRCLVLVLTALMLPGLCFMPAICLGQGPTKVIKVMVDPGHGGQDTGSKGSRGVLEKDLTLSLARKLVQVMEATGTISPVLIRTDDYAISLDERAGLANNRDGDLLISLHLGNTFMPVQTGFSIYYWSPTAASPSVTPSPFKGRPWDQEQEPYWEKSRRLASLMQEELLWSIPWASGGVLSADIYLLRRVRMPAVLLEIGSLNHPEEAVKLQKPEFQEAIAKALTQAIIKYRSLGEKGILLPQTIP